LVNWSRAEEDVKFFMDVCYDFISPSYPQEAFSINIEAIITSKKDLTHLSLTTLTTSYKAQHQTLFSDFFWNISTKKP